MIIKTIEDMEAVAPEQVAELLEQLELHLRTMHTWNPAGFPSQWKRGEFLFTPADRP